MNNERKPLEGTKTAPAARPEPTALDKAAAATAIRMVATTLGESPLLCFFTGDFTQIHTDLKTLLHFHGQPLDMHAKATHEVLGDMPKAWRALESEVRLVINHLADLADDRDEGETAMPEHLKAMAEALHEIIEPEAKAERGKACERGVRDRQKGAGKCDIPYDLGTRMARAWLDGWEMMDVVLRDDHPTA